MASKELSLITDYMQSFRLRYVTGGCLLLLTNGFALLIPWFMKLAVEALQYPGSAKYSPSVCALSIVLLATLHCVTRIFSRTQILNASRLIEFRIREDLFKHLMKLDLQFYSTSRTGDILSRFANDLTNVRMLVGFGVMSAINTVIIYLFTVSLMARIHPWLTFLAILPFPLMVLVVKKISHRLFQRSLEAQEELARLSNLAEESVSAARLIKSYCREEYFQEHFARTADRYLQHNLRLARLRGMIIPVMATATGAGTLVVLFVGGNLVISRSITLGDFVAFSGYLAMLVWPTAVLGWILTLAQRGTASMSRLAAILNAESAVQDFPHAESIDKITSGVECRNLSFSYGDAHILKNISLRIAAGERIGITGAVGCGKTTLLRLIARLLPVEDNMLYINGHDIKQVSSESIRQLIGYVPQEAFLFSRSIRENVAYGLPEDDEGTVVEACRQSGFSDDLEKFAHGFETLIGEKGVTLSGGQKQRLAIARALATNPPLLLLDDPLSAVDAGREEEILAELVRLYRNRTVLVVSQRVSAFRDCNRILVLDNGRIVEEGTSVELVERGGLFAEMSRLQQIREELGKTIKPIKSI